MSLQVWLPLTKDLHNQGLFNTTIINNGATYETTGKIGGCYNFVGSKYAIFDNPIDNTCNEFSICAWVYPTSTSSSYLYVSRTVSGDGYGIFLALYGTSIRFSDGSMWNQGVDLSTVNKWYHLCFTKNSSEKRVYVDGELVASTTTIGNLNNIGITGCIGTNYYDGRGSVANNSYIKVSDFRIYDNCLSEKEIKEISQGLIIHYLLDGDSLSSLGYQRLEYLQSTGTQCIDTGIVPQNTYTYKFKYSIDTISGYLGPFGSYSAESVNTTRVIIRNGSTTDLLIFFDCKAGGGGLTISSITTTAGQVIEGHLSKTSYLLKNLTTGITMSNSSSTDLFTTKGTALTEHMTLFSYGSIAYMEGKIYYFDTCIDDTYIQRLVPVKRISDNVLGMFDLMSGIFFTNIGSGTFIAGPVITESTIEYDGSGFQNNGTRNGIFTWSSDTPNLYNVSTYFNDYTSYIKAPMGGWTPTEITLSCWVKSSNKSPRGKWHIPLNLDGQKAEISINKNGQITTGFIIAGTRRTGNFGSVDILNGQWHMLTVTFDGTNIKSYIDANLIETRNYAGALSSMNYVYCGIFGGDNSFANTQLYQSDVRVYATALSAKDITSLYQNSAYIDDNNVIYGKIR